MAADLSRLWQSQRLPSCEGSGLKFRKVLQATPLACLPSCEGSGLKCSAAAAAGMSARLPSCEGSGLKSLG